MGVVALIPRRGRINAGGGDGVLEREIDSRCFVLGLVESGSGSSGCDIDDTGVDADKLFELVDVDSAWAALREFIKSRIEGLPDAGFLVEATVLLCCSCTGCRKVLRLSAFSRPLRVTLSTLCSIV